MTHDDPPNHPEPVELTDDEMLDIRHEIILDVDRNGETVGQIADLIDRDGFMPLIRAVLAIDGPNQAAINASIKVITDDIRLSLDIIVDREAKRMMRERVESRNG